jgi:dUTPase
MPRILFNRINENAVVPVKNNSSDLCFDLYATEEATIYPGQTVVVPLGLRAVLPEGYGFVFRERSGLASKGIIVGGGELDQGYRGEWKVILRYNEPEMVFKGGRSVDLLGSLDDGPSAQIVKGKPFEIKVGDRIAQGRLVRMIDTETEDISDEEFENYAETERGDGGFGASGR